MGSKDLARGLRPLSGGLTLPLLLFVLAGCGSNTGTVSGTVKYKGNPVPGAMVFFNDPEFKGVKQSFTDENGQYTVTDVPVGTVTITVLTQQAKLPPVARTPGGQKVEAKEGLKKAEELGKAGRKYVPIPRQYSMVDKSGLTYEVKPGAQDHDIELK